MKVVKKIAGEFKNKVTNLKDKTRELINNERGSLDQMVWLIGGAVVVVLVIAVFMALAPDTAKNVWDSFVDYATGTFGI